jgi:hypothetical protein
MSIILWTRGSISTNSFICQRPGWTTLDSVNNGNRASHLRSLWQHDARMITSEFFVHQLNV